MKSDLGPPLDRRPYQDGGVRAIREAYAAGKRSVMVVLPTGAGKTLTAAETAREFDVGSGRVVAGFVAHRDELLSQAERAFLRQLPGAKIGFEKGARVAAARSDVFFGSIQSLREERAEEVIDRFLYRLRLLIVDEAHRSAATSYRDLLALVRTRCPEAMFVGFTATPDRTDGVGLADIYEDVVYSYDAVQAIDDGWLVPVVAYRVESDVSVDGVDSRNGDFVLSKLGRAVNVDERNRRVVHAYRELAFGKRAIAFCAGVEHAKALAHSLQDAGVSAVAVYGSGMSTGERRRLLAAFEAGAYDVLCGADLFIEGFDVPGIEVVILARPTESGIVYRQSTGRGLRPHESIARQLGLLRDVTDRRALIAGSAKPHCIIIDVVDVTREKSIMTMPKLFGVPYTEEPRKAPVERLREASSLLDIEIGDFAVDVAERVEQAATPSGGALRITAIDVMAVEEQLTDEMSKAKYKWFRPSPGSRRIELPDQPVGLDAAGSVVQAFPLAYVRARDRGEDEPVQAACEETGTVSVLFVTVAGLIQKRGSVWDLRVFENGRPVVSAEEADLAPALRRIEALLRFRYPSAIAMVAGDASWRAKPPSRRQVHDLQARGLPVPATRGEARDTLAEAGARVESA